MKSLDVNLLRLRDTSLMIEMERISFAPLLLHFGSSGANRGKQGVLVSHSRDAVNAKDCIYNLRSISQAGRRGFESHLPLHIFNHLRGLTTTPAQADWQNRGFLRRQWPARDGQRRCALTQFHHEAIIRQCGVESPDTLAVAVDDCRMQVVVSFRADAH